MKINAGVCKEDIRTWFLTKFTKLDNVEYIFSTYEEFIDYISQNSLNKYYLWFEPNEFIESDGSIEKRTCFFALVKVYNGDRQQVGIGSQSQNGIYKQIIDELFLDYQTIVKWLYFQRYISTTKISTDFRKSIEVGGGSFLSGYFFNADIRGI